MGCAVDKACSTEDAEAGIGCELDEDAAELAPCDVGVSVMAAGGCQQSADSS